MNKRVALILVISLLLTCLVYVPVWEEKAHAKEDSQMSHGTRTTRYVGAGQTYTTIQSAINAANAGDTIRVYAGEYKENLFLGKTLSLIGNGSANTIINGTSMFAIQIYENWCNISNFKIKCKNTFDVDTGIQIESSNVTIKSCNFSMIPEFGIVISNSDSLVENCSFYNNNWVASIYGINNTLKSCTFEKNLYAIDISGSKIKIINTTIFNQAEGIAVSGPFNEIKYCTIKDITNYAMDAGSNNNYVHHNNFINNNPTGIQASDSGTNNHWNLSGEGNYWSDWKTPDVDFNGIVDNPYNLSGTSGSKDYFPLTQPIGTMQLFTPQNLSAVEDMEYSEPCNARFSPNLVTWKYNSNANWLTFTLNHTLEGTPKNSEIGTYWVDIQVMDGIVTRHQNLTLKALNVNDEPNLQTTDVNQTLEDSPYYVDYDATDIDPTGDTLTWNWKSNASFLSFEQTNAILSGNPDNSNVGKYWVNITVNDGNNGWNISNFTLTVININDAPNIDTLDITSIQEDSVYYVDYNATDIDPTNDLMTWSLSTNAEFLTLNSNSGVLSGTPDNFKVGNYWVNVNVSDGKSGYDSTNFTLSVLNVNDLPIINTTDIISCLEDQEYSVQYFANDIDPILDTLTWACLTDASWFSFNPSTAILGGTPSNSDVGDYWVNITVDDGNSGRDWSNFTLTVININDPPSIISSDLVYVYEATPFYNQYEAIDIDPTNDTLTWNLSTDAPFLSIDPFTGNLSGLANETQLGMYDVRVNVSDGNGGVDWSNFTLTVLNTNTPPDITSINTITVLEDQLYYVDYEAFDIDPTNDILTWSLITNADFLIIDESFGVLQGTPEQNDVGTCWVNVTVEDGNNGYDHTNFTLTIKNVNDAPILKPIGERFVYEDNWTQIQLEAFDSDGDTITYQTNIADKIPGLALSDRYSFDKYSGLLRLCPNNTMVGTYIINISSFDGFGGNDTKSFELQIVNINDRPSCWILSPEKNSTYLYAEYVNFRGIGVDEDISWGNILNFTWTSNINNVLGYGDNITTRTLSPGNHTITLIVSDGSLTNQSVTTITIIERAIPVDTDDDDTGNEWDVKMLTLFAIILVIVILLCILFAWVIIKKRAKEKEDEDEGPETLIDEKDLEGPTEEKEAKKIKTGKAKKDIVEPPIDEEKPVDDTRDLPPASIVTDADEVKPEIDAPPLNPEPTDELDWDDIDLKDEEETEELKVAQKDDE